MSVSPIKKLTLGAAQGFGPLSGLGPIDYGPHGAMRPVLGDRLDLPVAMEPPFLWELHLTGGEEGAPVEVALAGTEERQAVVCRAGVRAEVVGMVPAGGPARALSFQLFPAPEAGPVWFLGLSLLPLGTWRAA